MQNAKAEIWIFDTGNKTLIEGTIVVGEGNFWIGIVLLLVFMVVMYYVWSQGVSPIWPCISSSFILALVYSWFDAYRDRNHLYNLIQSVVESAHGHDNKTKNS